MFRPIIPDRWGRLVLIAVIVCVTIIGYSAGWYRGVHHVQHLHPAVSAPDIEKRSSATPGDVMEHAQTHPATNSLSPVSPEHALNAFDAGYGAAQEDLAEALRRISTTGGAALEQDFVIGVFTYAARHLRPGDALRICLGQGETARGPALRALVAEWVSSGGDPGDEDRKAARDRAFEMRGDQLGLEVDLAALLAASGPSIGVANAWLEAFSGHPGRSEMAARLMGDVLLDDPAKVFGLADHWTDWEEKRFDARLFDLWASEEPESAWDWFADRPDIFAADTAAIILDRWASLDAQAVQTLLDSLQRVDHRHAAVEALATALSHQSTSEAVTWADQLEDAYEQHTAYEQIVGETPRGIGLVIAYADGFPTIAGVVSGGPLANSGLAQGDLIVAVTQADGTTQSLYGTGLRPAVQRLRGDAGSEVEVHVLRPDVTTGTIEEYAIRVTREQLVIERPSSEE